MWIRLVRWCTPPATRGLRRCSRSRTLPLLAAARRTETGATFRLDDSDGAGGKSAYLVGADRSILTGWRVFLKQPFAEVFLQTEIHYLLASLCFLAVLGVCLPLARLLSLSFTRPLETLVAAIRAFAVDSNRLPQLRLRQDAPSELSELLEDFRQVAGQI